MSDYKEKLARARQRRGIPESLIKSAYTKDRMATASVALDSLNEAVRRDISDVKGRDACDYARTCMKEVPSKITETSIQEGERVKSQLDKGLSRLGCPFKLEYQGSVPMNVHIRSSHDVDILVIGTRYLRFDPSPPTASTLYTACPDVSIPEWLLSLRKKSTGILETAYAAAEVNKEGAKSIAISGGSLVRKIDVVPSCWFDSAAYQEGRDGKDRGIVIVDKDTKETPTNYPFLVRYVLGTKDLVTLGGAKHVIRLLKCLKDDAGVPLSLSSFDIVSLVCHIPSSAITRNQYKPFAIVEGAHTALEQLTVSGEVFKLKTVDGTREIFNEVKKKNDFLVLISALGLLCDAIADEVSPAARYGMLGKKQALREYVEA